MGLGSWSLFEAKGDTAGKMDRTQTNALLACVAVTVICAFAGFAAVYVTLGRGDNDGRTTAQTTEAARTASSAPAAPSGAGVNPLSTGQMTTFVFKKAPEPLGDIAFTDAEGRQRSLKDWQGRVVLLNLWATWCAPCRKEMPSLDRLQKKLGSNEFEVVALAVDRAGTDAARKFLEQVGTETLALYVDGTARSGAALKAVGMPTTIMIDREGREIGRLTGPAEWDSEDAERLIKAVLDQHAQVSAQSAARPQPN
jgi:thiol-disulfide isomerase/thioredoxin